MEFHSNFPDRLYGDSKLFGREQQRKTKKYCCQQHVDKFARLIESLSQAA